MDACFLFAFKGVKQENSPNANDSTRKTVRFGFSEVIRVFVVEQGLYYSSSETCPRQRACNENTALGALPVTCQRHLLSLPCLASLPVLGMRLAERTFPSGKRFSKTSI